MSAKQKEILKWLEVVFGENKIPSFEKNEANIEYLYNTMLLFKDHVEDFENGEKLKAEASNHLNCYVEEKLKILQIFDVPNILQIKEKTILESLNNLCYQLDLESPCSTNIILGIQSIEDKNEEVNSLLMKEKFRTKKLLKLSENTAKNLEELKNISEQAENTAVLLEDQRKKEEKISYFCQIKNEKYTLETQQLESQLAFVGLEEETSYPVLTKNMNELQELEKQYKEAKRTLESYTLPPDMSLAMIEVEKLRQQLSNCMHQIAHKYEKPS